ncbi:MAG TPA: amidohydrolase family protein [Flavobacterium sp.]|nr:amidohydrolase family protein [Flavobacterium sp.]
MKKYLTIYLLLLTLLQACKPDKTYDLVITHTQVLDVKTGKTTDDQTILILNGRIEAIVSRSDSYTAKETIDAKGKLVTPGFIDTHVHPTDVFGDYENAPTFLAKDSLVSLRKKLSDDYLPHGTTTVLTMGQPENWLTSLTEWQKTPDPNYVDFYVCGGALISKDNRVPYIGHTEVVTPEKARQKIIAYHNLGLQHLKLYFRLKEPEFSVCCKTADSLKMKVYGHIGDFNPAYLTMQHTLNVGLTNYEHIATIPNSIITTDADWEKLNKQFNANFGELNTEARMLEFFLEQFRFIDENKKPEMVTFINNLARKKGTFSTTIHRIYEQFEPTYFTTPKDTTLTTKQLKRCRENFAIMMKYTKTMQDKGIEIRLGSDMPNGGKVNISELLILSKYGFSVSEVVRIASYNGAKAMGIEHETGSVEQGKKANLILWEQNPFEDPRHFMGKMTIVKGGKIVKT